MKERYYLKANWQENWTEVTQEQFIKAERVAGFRPKYGCGPVATGGFSDGNTSGRVTYEADDKPAAERDVVSPPP